MRITLGVTGGVAAYKAADLLRRLQQDGFTVQVVMTRGAREFVTPLTFAALSGQKVITDLFGDSSGGEAISKRHRTHRRRAANGFVAGGASHGGHHREICARDCG